MARRVLGWPAERPVTVHGGLTFGGGPVANYMTHAMVAMVRKLRVDGRTGLLFGNGGYCEHNHCIVLSRVALAGVAFPQDYDAQALADAQRGAIPPLTDAVEGSFPIETYTVFYDRNGDLRLGVVLSRSDKGERIIAMVDGDDAASLAFLTDGKVEPVGMIGHNRRSGDKLMWSAE
jgi:acetyl-CoA C-acetyltransferase